MIFKFLLALNMFLTATICIAEPETFERIPEKKVYSTGLVIPKDWKSKAIFKDPRPEKQLLGLPRHWDWREQGKLSNIEDQGSCGSCWSFSTTATFQDALALRKVADYNLSEQWLLSCNDYNFSCQGGFFAHDMHVNPGAALDKDFPYVGTQVACKKTLAHPYKLVSWAYIPTSIPDGVLSVDSIKQAIYQFGTISVGVAVNDAFMKYKTVIFNGCDNGVTQPNHAVNLVGWDDDGQYWIMRNSWNATWGEKGYMRIKWGCNFIGVSANYVVVDNKPVDKCTPMPVANLGPDVTIRRGMIVTIGVQTQTGTTYRWESSVKPDQIETIRSSLVRVKPWDSRAYTLYVTTKCGVAKDTKIIYVRR